MAQRVTIDLSYPDWVTHLAPVQDWAEARFSQARRNFVSAFKVSPFRKMDLNFHLTNTSSTYRYAGRYVTLMLRFSWYVGGPYGDDWIETITYDMRGQRFIDIYDLFEDEKAAGAELAKQVRQRAKGDILRLMGKRDEVAASNLTNFRTFALTDTAMLLFLPPYGFHTVFSGDETIGIPLTELSDLLTLTVEAEG
ncbi:MAG: hypothetical protein CL607_17130 [Anaerolineaceae bacterium]|nr:hypothetical protein [Anaerolineaceae bacterium]